MIFGSLIGKLLCCLMLFALIGLVVFIFEVLKGVERGVVVLIGVVNRTLLHALDDFPNWVKVVVFFKGAFVTETLVVLSSLLIDFFIVFLISW